MRAAHLAVLIIIVLIGISTVDARGRYPWYPNGSGSCSSVGGYCATPGSCRGRLTNRGSCRYRQQWCCMPRRKSQCRAMGGYCRPRGQCRGGRLNKHFKCGAGRECCLHV
uniref:Putative secreted protein n=1 Tax=Amblyomma americanum TaxID=6943 RepID=A0A0C9R489_AMBAM